MINTGSIFDTVYRTYLGLYHTFASNAELGTNIFDRDWDLLIVLDACRVDALREVAEEFDFIPEVESVWSVGCSSHEWFSRTFTTQHRTEIESTALTTPNGFAEITFRDSNPAPEEQVPIGNVTYPIVNEEDFALLDTPWVHGQKTKFGTVSPRFMTDRAIHMARTVDCDRHIVQYYQPHIPYLSGAIRDGRELTPEEENPWQALKRGELEKGEVWELYLDNLRFVLEEIKLLSANVDADKICITSDHGEAFGEWGIYAHPSGVPHPHTRRVPWVEMSAPIDRGTHEPDDEHLKNFGGRDYHGGNEHEEALEKHLEALGYR